MNNSIVVFDGDDTLWRTEGLYDEARDAAARIISDSGLDGSDWVPLQKATDLKLVTELGLSSDRFRRSFEESYVELCSSTGVKPDTEILRSIKELAACVFSEKAPVVDGAPGVLEALSSEYRLVLHTQGEEWVQRKRVRESQLEPHFERIYIVFRKDESNFHRILDESRVKPDNAWSVGNSLPSDVNPALAVGMSAIWIPAHVWDHELREAQAHPGRLHIVDDIRQVPGLLDSHTQDD